MKNRVVWVLFGIAIIGISVLTYLYIEQKTITNELVGQFELDKLELENEYTLFANKYNEIKSVSTGDSLVTLLDEEKQKVKNLLEELKSVKASNVQEVQKLKKELATVRKIMVGYIVQIDSLNRINQELTLENTQVKAKINEATVQIKNLSQEKQNLNQKVSIAAQLDATNLWIAAKDRKNKAAKKVNDVVQIEVGFTLAKNPTAKVGDKNLYIRITTPNREVLTKNATNTFAYENRQLPYSIRKSVEYTGEEQAVVVYWKVDEFLYPGAYRAEIFADGSLIGQRSITLK